MVWILVAALAPGVAVAVCEPTFETVPRALARTWVPIPPHLPDPGEDTVWTHPTQRNGHALRVHHVADKAVLQAAGIAPETLNTRHEYSQHSAFSATGRWLVSHGKEQRVLFDGMQYKPVRTVQDNGPLLDWLWDPVDDDTAYYVSQSTHAVVRYDVETDTHTPAFTRAQLARHLDLPNADALRLEGHHGQGALSASGDRLVTKFARGEDAVVVVFNPRTADVISHATFPGLAGRRNMDWQALSPSGKHVIVQAQFDALYGTQFAGSRGTQQVRVFDTARFEATSGKLVIGRPSHFDVMQNSNGREFFVIAGSQPPQGWRGLSSPPRGLVQGLYTVDLDSLTWRQHLNFRERFQNGVPAAHVSAAPDRAEVLLSFYQGGNEDSASDAQTTPLLLVDLDATWRVRTAWMGWDLAANPGRGNSSQGYLAQPHASFSPGVWLANGERGLKLVWASDNNRRDARVGNLVVAEVICPAGATR